MEKGEIYDNQPAGEQVQGVPLLVLLFADMLAASDKRFPTVQLAKAICCPKPVEEIIKEYDEVPAKAEASDVESTEDEEPDEDPTEAEEPAKGECLGQVRGTRGSQ